MIKVIEEENEYIIRCPHCGRKLSYTINDVFSSYMRGLQDSEGWCDCDCVWHYIRCPECSHMIDIKSNLSDEDDMYLSDKFNKMYE